MLWKFFIPNLKRILFWSILAQAKKGGEKEKILNIANIRIKS